VKESTEIVIAGSVDVDPTRREAALEAAKTHMAATREMPGCCEYVWSADPLKPGRIHVFERWSSRENLEAHFASPHYPAMRDTIASYGIVGLDIAKYRYDLREPVYDPHGKPRADFFTDV
jgi:quinol monooxygenase YgiN